MPAVSSILAGSALAVGAGSAIYGADQQRKAINKANDANAKSVADTNAANYRMWLQSRGVGTNGQPINTKYPAWMTAQVGTTQKRRIVPKGTASAAASTPTITSGTPSTSGWAQG